MNKINYEIKTQLLKLLFSWAIIRPAAERKIKILNKNAMANTRFPTIWTSCLVENVDVFKSEIRTTMKSRWVIQLLINS